MKLNYNVTGAERKSLVAAISQALNAPTKYLGAPTFAYEVGGYHIDKTGTVVGADYEELVGRLEAQGFTGEVEFDIPIHAKEGGEGENFTYQAELSDPECPDRMEVFSAENDEGALRQAYEFCEGEVLLLELKQLDENYNFVRVVEITPRTDRLTIEVPLKGFTPEKLDNLAKLVNAKATLLKTALSTDDIPIRQTADALQFPWFNKGGGAIDADHADSYATFVSLLCKTAREKKRVTAKEKDVGGSPKYAMRCFLLSLGMIGDEYKKARKILLSRLEGNSSWKNGKKAETEAEEVTVNE